MIAKNLCKLFCYFFIGNSFHWALLSEKHSSALSSKYYRSVCLLHLNVYIVLHYSAETDWVQHRIIHAVSITSWCCCVSFYQASWLAGSMRLEVLLKMELKWWPLWLVPMCLRLLSSLEDLMVRGTMACAAEHMGKLYFKWTWLLKGTTLKTCSRCPVD